MRALNIVRFLRRRTISRDLTLGLVLMTVLVVSIFGAAYQIYYTSREISDLEIEAAGVADEFASVLSRPLWNMDTETVSHIARAYLSSNFLSGARLTTGSIVLMDTIPDPWAEDGWLLLQREIANNGEVIGAVELLFSNALIEAARRRSIGLTLLTIVLVSLVIGLGSHRLMKYLVERPLNRLVAGIRTIAAGDYQLSMPLENWTDVNLLVNEINLMAREIDRREADLKRLRGTLKNIIDSMPSMLVGVDPDGRVTQWNREAEDITGIKSDAAIGDHIESVYPALAGTMEKVTLAIREQRPSKEGKVLQRVGGEVRFSDITVYPLLTSPTGGAVIRIDDITERVRIEEMMIQSEKMLSVGGLAAGMAHEINNPLAGILQNIQVMQNRLSDTLSKNHDVARELGLQLSDIQAYMAARNMPEMLASIMESGKRAARIVENMLSFSRKSESTKSLNDLAKLMDATLELAENDYDLKKRHDFRRIEIVRDYDPEAPHIWCETTKIQQVFLNILKNGAQAMADISGSDPPRFVLRVRAEDRMVRVEIIDNGPGMEEGVRKRIFEPFFTTKPVGVGTGLGLSVSYFIITDNHGGTMSVHSAPGSGSRFVIHLPVGDHPAASAAPSRQKLSTAQR